MPPFPIASPTTGNSNPPVVSPDPSATRSEPKTPLSEIDSQFQQIGCLGHGGFGSVFLAQKPSGRRVALKFCELNNDDDDDRNEMLQREIDAVIQLECTRSSEGLAIVYFEDWFIGDNYACIVMQHADGGTLSQEILAKQERLDQGHNGEPYTERRIASYALQLSSALHHAHSRGVAHFDIKSANVLIDRTGGGRLLLADFGSAVSPGGEPENFTEIYASPELQRAHAHEDFSALDPTKVDMFGLGCILYELICCKKLVDLTGDQTLAEFIVEKQTAEATLALPCVRLPFLPEQQSSQNHQQQVGYSHFLKSMVTNLLELLPNVRSTPLVLQNILKDPSYSPLLQDWVIAAQPPQPGAPVTVDNIQLGMLVQRGPDWADGDSDGGIHSVGAVVKLDCDAGYTEVAFPSQQQNPETLVCRIGAGNKFELAVGPPSAADFLGILKGANPAEFVIGQRIDANCMVVGIQDKTVLVAPTEKIAIQQLPFHRPQPVVPPVLLPKNPPPEPDNWQHGTDTLPEITDASERQQVLVAFTQNSNYEIGSIRRIQNPVLWKSYAAARERVAAENWGIANEKRLFIGTGQYAPETLHRHIPPQWFFSKCVTNANDTPCFKDASGADHNCHRSTNSSDGYTRQLVLCRVALGRTKTKEGGNREAGSLPPHSVIYHSETSNNSNGNHYEVKLSSTCQAYPEYLVSYKLPTTTGRRVLRARRPARPASGRAPLPPQPNRNWAARRVSTNQAPVPAAAEPSSSGRASQPLAAGSARIAKPSASAPRMVSPPARPPLASPVAKSSHSASKLCVICMERDVTMILIPCGHPCLCEACGSKKVLKKMKKKCPECRKHIDQVVRMYGRVVED
ncbi:calmodulin-dependent protein kinase type II subunit delta [Seminavis robusta]|uniref:NEK6-subfamily protein kinase n=1 Tax=Seminavis robusta TaxID=568900 RepID=A0A9N8HFJ6_9STRA|nr:calmodulin-dependent protein kinase type II subunit delta [Seminavis robusta]|eukprot:Sro575_g169290.1 calmodulin-dependent protein kinase type II subunit delta (854) ;mRNA; f:10132-12693